jgi:tetratricopeptide (TPR) repeat protein
MVRRLVLAVTVALAAAAPARAQLDAEPKQPYLWRVVLAAKPHPLLTAELRDRVRRDIVAALQTGLGPLGAVEVIDPADARDRGEPLWQQFEDRGFAALDAPRDLTGVKTHFLKLEYRDGQFHMQARQYDGFTGLASPLVRSRSVRAADQIGRAAGLLLDRDFGLVGTVELNPAQPDAARVLIRGAGLGPIGGLVERGDVFAVAAVRKTDRPAPAPVRTATGKLVAPPPGAEAAALTSTPRPFVLLKVTDVGPDAVRVAVLPGDAKALPLSGGVVGYRCMKLGTVKAPVSVRLVGSDGAVEKTASRVAVRASDALFPNPAAADLKDACAFDAPTAAFKAPRDLSGVACVTVTLAGQTRYFAAPVLTADPITLPFEVNEAKARLADFQREVAAALAAVAEARLAQSVCFDAVTQLLNKQQNAAALKRARDGLGAAEGAYAVRSDELKRLREQEGIAPTAKPVLDKIERDLAELKQHNDKLKSHVGKIEEVVKLESNPALAAKEIEARRLNEQIKLLLAVGDVEQALAAYAQLIALNPDDKAKVAEREKVAAEWKIKDEAHQKARDYLLKTWPTAATVQDFKDSAVKQNNIDPPLRVHVDVCKKHGDKWTLRKLRASFDAAGVKLNELVAGLDAANEADKKLLADASAAGKALAALEQDIRTFIGD